MLVENFRATNVDEVSKSKKRKVPPNSRFRRYTRPRYFISSTCRGYRLRVDRITCFQASCHTQRRDGT